MRSTWSSKKVEPLIETDIKAQGIVVLGKEILPRSGELSPNVLKPAIARLLGETLPEVAKAVLMQVFPRVRRRCAWPGPHLGVRYTLAQMRNTTISGDIGCYTLGFGQPWNALDACILRCGASMGMAHGLDKGRADAEKDKSRRGDRRFDLYAHGHAGLAQHRLQPRQRHRADSG